MVHLAFKHTTNTGPWYAKLLDKLISVRSNGDAVHVELVFSDGVSFSASQWDKGVRFKQIEYVNDPKWVLVPVHISEAEESVCRNVASILSDMGIKYDWRGVLGFFVGKKNPGDLDKLFCSEACVWVLKHVGVFKHLDPASTDPWLLECVAVERNNCMGPGPCAKE